MAADQAVSAEPAQRLSEHLAADAADELDQIAMATRALAEGVKDDDRSIVSDDFDGQPGGPVGEEDDAGFGEVTHGSYATDRYLP